MYHSNCVLKSATRGYLPIMRRQLSLQSQEQHVSMRMSRRRSNVSAYEGTQVEHQENDVVLMLCSSRLKGISQIIPSYRDLCNKLSLATMQFAQQCYDAKLERADDQARRHHLKASAIVERYKIGSAPTKKTTRTGLHYTPSSVSVLV